MRPHGTRAFRRHALDGALLYFQPSTGRSIRVDATETRPLRRRAPRVVLFSLSHACNLDCSFCSRDVSQDARWSADDAFDLLSALSRAGTLEVVFGGGEPLAYAGFSRLIERLGRETELAIHFTTNGALLDDELARALAPWVGEARVSIYADQDWAGAMECLGRHGIQAAANVLVRPRDVGGLSVLLDQLDGLGCNNVALLRYVGPDRSLHLDGSDWDVLEEVIHRARLPVRLSQCFADRLPGVPRLFGAGSTEDPTDCGAGRDFLVIGPDKTVSPCSFHGTARPFETVEELLRRYTTGDLGAATPAEALGCARPLTGADLQTEGVRCYQGFSSNNSGDTVLVARFETAREPRDLAERVATLEPEREPVGWRAFLTEEGCDPSSVDVDSQVVVAGRALLAGGYDAHDALPGLREVITRRGGLVVYTAVHLHDAAGLVVGLGGAAGSDALERELWQRGAAEVREKGADLYALVPEAEGWVEKVRELSGLHDGAFSAELLETDGDEDLLRGLKSTPRQPTARSGHLQLWFPNSEVAARFERSFGEDRATRAGATVLVAAGERQARTLLSASRKNGVGSWLPEGALRLTAHLYHRDYRKPPFRSEQLQDALRHSTLRASRFTIEDVQRSVRAQVVTDDPHRPMRELERAANHLGAVLSVGLRPAQPLAHAVERIRRDLVVLED